MRLPYYEYFELENLPIGEIPFSAIQRAIKDEKYFRKFPPTNYRNDLLIGYPCALLYWYPKYIDYLYEEAINDRDFMLFFKGFNPTVKDDFEFLFPEIVRKLRGLRKSVQKLNHFDEIKL